MDELRTKTVTSVSGGVSISVGLNLSQILGVFKQGEQKDYAGFVLLSSLDGSDWTFIMPNRISFGSNFPLVAGEKIRIIYKVTV